MSPTILNFDEAQSYYRTIEDPITQELVGMALSRLIIRWMHGDRPGADFDARFFVKVLEDALGNHRSIAHVLDGGTLRWPEI